MGGLVNAGQFARIADAHRRILSFNLRVSFRIRFRSRRRSAKRNQEFRSEVSTAYDQPTGHPTVHAALSAPTGGAAYRRNLADGGCPYRCRLTRSPSLPLSLAGVRSTGRTERTDRTWRTPLEHGGLSAPSSFDFVAVSGAEPFAPPTNSQRTRRPSSSSFSALPSAL